MKSILFRLLLPILCIAASSLSADADPAGPTTSVRGDYLMTLYVPIVEAHVVDDHLRVINHPDGWVKGPDIAGKIIPPSGDTLRSMGDGIYRLDVRLTVQTNDNQIIYVSYNGLLQCQKEIFDRYLKGEMLKTGDCYFITAPTFETQSERYRWLNGVQAVGKMLEMKRGEDGHLIYDIFVVR